MTLCQEAEQLIKGDRHQAYGPAKDSFKTVSKIWSGLFNTEVTPEQVILGMIGYKMQRESFKHQRDNLVDIIGYTLLLEQLYEDSPR